MDACEQVMINVNLFTTINNKTIPKKNLIEKWSSDNKAHNVIMQHRKKGQPRQSHVRLGNNDDKNSLQQKLIDELRPPIIPLPSNSSPDVICEVVADAENDMEQVVPDASCEAVADVENGMEPPLVDDVSNEDDDLEESLSFNDELMLLMMKCFP